MPEDWAAYENRALAWRPTLLGLPRVYAAFLFGITGLIGLSANYLPAAAILFGFGVLLGRLGTWFDPLAWDLLPRRARVPYRLHP